MGNDAGAESNSKENTKPKAADSDQNPENNDKKKKTKEPKFFRVDNPGRVTQRQRKYMVPIEGQRYEPILNVHSGIVMLVDSTPDADETFVDFSKPLNPESKAPGEEDEPAPPKPFIWR